MHCINIGQVFNEFNGFLPCREKKFNLLDELECPDELAPLVSQMSCKFMWINRFASLVLDFELLHPAVDEALSRLQLNR